MSGKSKETGLGRRCARCRAACIVFEQQAYGEKRPPITGAFRFRCSWCGADNKTTAEDLVRLPVASARDHAA